jgi:hypothetical protein
VAVTEAYLSHAAMSPALGGVFDAVSDAQWAAGFSAGYRRAVSSLLADIALIATELGREPGTDNPEARQAIRRLRGRIEQHLEGEANADNSASPAADGYVDGGLGI